MRLLEEIFPFVAYLVYRRRILARNATQDVATAANLSLSELKTRLTEEHERAKTIDDKTFKMTLSITLGLTIFNLGTAALIKGASSSLATVMTWMLLFSVGYMMIGGFLALSALATQQTFGYGTAFRLQEQNTPNPVQIYAEALINQERSNQTRHIRNEAAFQCLRNGFLLLSLVLLLYLFSSQTAQNLPSTGESYRH